MCFHRRTEDIFWFVFKILLLKYNLLISFAFKNCCLLHCYNSDALNISITKKQSKSRPQTTRTKARLASVQDTGRRASRPKLRQRQWLQLNKLKFSHNLKYFYS